MESKRTKKKRQTVHQDENDEEGIILWKNVDIHHPRRGEI